MISRNEDQETHGEGSPSVPSAAWEALEPSRRTAEAMTSNWRAVRDRARPWSPPTGEILVVVPHPDDESLSTGGLIAKLTGKGQRVDVIAVTRGESAYPQGSIEPSTLGGLRELEQRRALDRLGGSRVSSSVLGFEDGRLQEREQELETILTSRLPGYSLIVAPWRYDHHADHVACGRAARRAARSAAVPLAGSLFWAWHHGSVEELDRVPVVKLTLSEEEHEARREAALLHGSQFTSDFGAPILSGSDLEPLDEPFEYYIYDELL